MALDLGCPQELPVTAADGKDMGAATFAAVVTQNDLAAVDRGADARTRTSDAVVSGDLLLPDQRTATCTHGVEVAAGVGEVHDAAGNRWCRRDIPVRRERPLRRERTHVRRRELRLERLRAAVGDALSGEPPTRRSMS